jgi:hypothetical protein
MASVDYRALHEMQTASQLGDLSFSSARDWSVFLSDLLARVPIKINDLLFC